MTVAVDWKKALLISLVVLLVVIGLPILMPGMGGGHCADCGPAMTAGALCALAAVLVAEALIASLLVGPLRQRCTMPAALLRAVSLDRPPRLA